MIRTRRKTLKMMLIITVLVVITYYIVLSSRKPVQNQVRPKFALQKVMAPHHTFRILLNDKTIVEEDYNHRPSETVFKPLCDAQSLKLNQSIIGKQTPISFIGPSEKFSVANTYRRAISESDKILSLFVFQKFVDACEMNKISYFMKGRTLIGSYRHHGIVPWDDGAEVYVDSAHKPALIEAVKKLEQSAFKMLTPEKDSWKFFHEVLSIPTFGKAFRWPYVEIFFWTVTGDIFYDTTTPIKRNAHKPKFVFPLEKRPFEGALIPGPHNPRVFLKKNYNVLKCRANVFSRRHQIKSKWTITIPCRRLRKLYPFVRHYRKSNCKEKLYFKNQVLGTFQAKAC